MLKSRTVVLTAAAFGLAGAALAQVAPALAPKEAVAQRRDAYRETGSAFKTIRDQLASPTPLKIMLRTSIRRIQATARDQYAWFPAGSGPEIALETRAKAEIWTDPSTFHDAQTNFQKQADLMAQAIDAGDAPAMQVHAKALGDACAACHDKFRAPED